MKRIKLVLLLISFAFSQYLSGCAPAGSSNVSPVLMPGEPTVSSEKTLSLVLTNTINPTKTLTPVLTNTPNQTETLTPTPTLTATALSPQDAYKVLQNLYKDNGSCELPCYWKIVPGETLWSDVAVFVSSVRGKYGQYGTPKIARYDLAFPEFDPMRGFSPRIWVENGIVKAIGINSKSVRQDFDYRLSGLLKTFGKPEEIWIRPIAESSVDQPFYDLILMYPSKGILVILFGNAEKRGQYLAVCPQNIFSRSIFSPELLVWDSKIHMTFDNFGKRLLDDDLGWVMDEYRPLQELSATNLTPKEFYYIYSQPNTETCIKVSPVR